MYIIFLYFFFCFCCCCSVLFLLFLFFYFSKVKVWGWATPLSLPPLQQTPLDPPMSQYIIYCFYYVPIHLFTNSNIPTYSSIFNNWTMTSMYTKRHCCFKISFLCFEVFVPVENFSLILLFFYVCLLNDILLVRVYIAYQVTLFQLIFVKHCVIQYVIT